MSINYQFYKELFYKLVLLHYMMSFEEENMNIWQIYSLFHFVVWAYSTKVNRVFK